MKELGDNLVDGKEDKHWEEMDDEGAQEKENEEQRHMRMRKLKKPNEDNKRTE